MKPFLAKFSIVLVVLGFIWPLFWIAACLTGVLWIGASEPGLRPDGERRNGGLLGPVWDDFVVSRKMVECPHCLTLIFREAAKCRHCGEWVCEPGSQPPNAPGAASNTIVQDVMTELLEPKMLFRLSVAGTVIGYLVVQKLL